MVSNDVDAGHEVKFIDSKVVTKKSDSTLCMDSFFCYYDEVSISVVEFIDKQRNDNDTMIFSIIFLGKMTTISSYSNNWRQ